MENLIQRFHKTASLFPTKIACGYKENNKWVFLSYEELKKEVNSYFSFLEKNNIEKEDRVSIILENTIEWPLSFLGIIQKGASVVPVDYESNSNEIEAILKDSGSIAVFTDKRTFSEKLKKINVNSLKKIFITDEADFKNNISQCQKTHEKKAYDSSSTACILYTSGSTGEPKGVVLSHKNLLSNAESLIRCNVFTEKDSVAAVLPLHHPYPLMATLFLPLFTGGSSFFAGNILRSDLLSETAKEVNPTFFITVPEMLNLIYKNIKSNIKNLPFFIRPFVNFLILFFNTVRMLTGINGNKLLLNKAHRKFGKNMRILVSGGARLDEEVELTLRKFGFPLIQGYGITEASPVVALNPLNKPKEGSVGLPLPGIEIRIDVAPKFKRADLPEEYEVGEVLVKGSNIMEGYFGNVELTRETLKDGWLYTGDIGYLDKEGYLFLTGRSKEIIVLSSGKNIYPEEIEKAYMKETPAREICVFDVPRRHKDEKDTTLAALVVPDTELIKKYGEMHLRSLIKTRFDNVSKSLPPRKRISRFELNLEELPKTRLRKIKRYEVKEKFLALLQEKNKRIKPDEKKLTHEDKAYLEEDINKDIVEYLKKETGEYKILPDELLEDIGIDSLSRIELSAGLEKLFDSSLDARIFLQSFTVRELIEKIKRSLPQDIKTEKLKSDDFKINWREILNKALEEKNLKKIDLNPSFFSWLGGFLFLGIIGLIFKLFYNLTVEGKENIPEKGPFIIYSNHVSFFDGLLIASSLKKRPRLDLFYIGYRFYFDVPVIRNLIKVGRIIPLDFTTTLLEALRSAYFVLKNGKGICLFPEGERSLDGNIMKFKKGFGILVKESSSLVLPVLIKGAYEAWPRGAKFPRLNPIKVKFGKPVFPEKLEKIGKASEIKDSYDAVSEGARKVLLSME